MGRLLHVLTHGAPLRELRTRELRYEKLKRRKYVQFLHSRNEFLTITVCFFILFLATSLQLAGNDFENILCFSSISRRMLLEKE